ncbi:nitrate- and nitrite sensing domain-containing protein [Nocardia sp. alder85J]|uniref:sensor histidine kinase n=1 Tax=Nocardia sp. alder85J TaxID=2862949 RepID=UPI001CD6E4C9|nr:nitrate- and nitrite sensing domain-containing protein [Nocardia sp. alder85J]MCX4091375.1 nitrate- and nitrite sensing domain-containing protein [Nocardia sp. alder85J]
MLAIVLIPCLALLVTGSILVVNLSSQARSAARWSDLVSRQIEPLATFAVATEDERAISLMVVAGDPQITAELPADRARLDKALAAIIDLSLQMQPLNPKGLAKSSPAIRAVGAQLPVIRQAIDLHHATLADVDNYYSQLVGIMAMGFEGIAPFTPSPASAAEEMTTGAFARMVDLHSRAVGIAAAATVSGPLNNDDKRAIALLVGGFRNDLDALTSKFTPADQAVYQKLIDSPQWHSDLDAEDQLVSRGAVPLSDDEARVVVVSVQDQLLTLFKTHAEYANSLVADAAHRLLVRSILAGVGVALITLLAFTIAFLMANGLVRRLRSLRSRTLHLADETLPAIIQRLHDGEQVDVAEAEAAVTSDRGRDEIAQVAAAFSSAQRTAMAAATAEARTRNGFNKVFVDIARRSQVLVRRQMDVLDVAQAKQHDPEHLELLFQLDHLATRARRNAENLLILGGAQPGRRWREPVAVEQIVRSAASETQDFARVSAIRMPDAWVHSNAVADLIHLLAELIDNATLFSPPEAPVTVHGSLVSRGLVIEIVDQGLGIRFEERERLNELLRNPPEFQEMTLAGHRHLGLFVVSRLARRHDITVGLQQSAYGGVNAVVLVPGEILDLVAPEAGPEPDEVKPPAPPEHLPRPVLDVVPSQPASDLSQLPPWPGSVPVAPSGNGSSPGLPRLAPTGRSRTPLPKRERQSHLAPQLRLEEHQPDTTPDLLPPERRAPEQIRHSMAAFQRGTHRARTNTPPTEHDDERSEREQ